MSDSTPQRRMLQAVGLALVVATGAHLGHLPLWAVALIPAAVGLRLGLRRPLGKLVLVPLVVATFAAVLLRFHSISGTVAGGALLSAMIALKALEARDARDAGLLACLAYFQAISIFLADQSIGMAAYVLLSAGVTTFALTVIAAPEGPDLGVRVRRSAGILAQAAPVMVVLFVLFPRIQGPLWALGGDQSTGITGIPNEMSPGAITELTRSSAVAFRVEFEGQPPPRAQRYWRGPVFWAYDGRTWSRGERRVETLPTLDVTGSTQRYTVTLEPHDRRWLFALDMPVPGATGSGRVTAGASLVAEDEITSVRGYEATSAFEYRLDPKLPEARLRRALELPVDTAPRARELAQRWRSEAGGARGIVERGLAYFRDNDFRYTLSPPPLGDRPVDQFLFETRSGFCEHYASAFAVLMRAAGVPTRVVAGYQGGETNAIGDYMVVRQSDAHAWTEVWLGEAGWVRVDPTSEVSRERIESGVSSVSGAAERLDALSRGDGGWLRSAALLWDSVNYGWNRFILGYGPQLQRRLLAGMGLADWGRYALGAMAVLAAALALTAVWLLAQRPPAPRDPARRDWHRALQRLRRAGIHTSVTEGPRDLSERVRRERPDLASGFTPIARAYIALRYRPAGRHAQGLAELRRAVRRFRPQRPQTQPTERLGRLIAWAGKWWPRRRQ